MILAIDPGTTQSGYVYFDGERVVGSNIVGNEELLARIIDESGLLDGIVIEMIASYGMPVGAEVFDTCVWIGRFTQAAKCEVRRVFRRDVKLHLCGSTRAKDGNIRQALIDKLGPPGTKKNRGPTYGVKSHAWAALGVAVTAAEIPRA